MSQFAVRTDLQPESKARSPGLYYPPQTRQLLLQLLIYIIHYSIAINVKAACLIGRGSRHAQSGVRGSTSGRSELRRWKALSLLLSWKYSISP